MVKMIITKLYLFSSLDPLVAGKGNRGADGGLVGGFCGGGLRFTGAPSFPEQTVSALFEQADTIV